MLKKKHEEIMVDMSNEIGLIGMHITMDCGYKRVVITQPKQVFEAFKTEKGAPTPASVKLMSNDLDSRLLADQSDYMLKCVTLFFLSQRTYPEICTATIRLSMKYNKATETDMQKATRVTRIYCFPQKYNQRMTC
jgi:hypothetical protein